MPSNKENNKVDDDIIPEDFFDDFSNTEFMAGLNVIDDITWEEGEDGREKKTSRSSKRPDERQPDRDRKRRKSLESPGREPDKPRSPERRRHRDSRDEKRSYSPPYAGRRYNRHQGRSPTARSIEGRRPPPGRRSRTRSRSRSPRGRRRSPPRKTPFLEELAQKLAEKGHSLSGLQPNPYAFQAQQNYHGYPPGAPGYPYPVQSAPAMVMPPYQQQMPLISYPNLPQYQGVPPPDFNGPPWQGQLPNFPDPMNINVAPQVAPLNISPQAREPPIPGTNPEPPEPMIPLSSDRRPPERFTLGLAEMLEDNYVSVKEHLENLLTKDSIITRCKKAIDALRGDAKANNAFIYVPMLTTKDVVDGSPVGQFHHMSFPWNAGKCDIEKHFITLSSPRSREIALKLGMNVSRMLERLKLQNVHDKMANNSAQRETDVGLESNRCAVAVQTDGFECPKCVQRELTAVWDTAAQTEPLPATPTIKDLLPDYDDMAINMLRRFGQQQRDILIYFMRLIERPDFVTPYHINTLTARLQDLPKTMFSTMREAPLSSYILNPATDFRRF